MSESFQVQLGSPLPLSFQMPANASGLFPRARIYDSSDVEVAVVNLTEVGSTARYTGASFTPLAVGTFTARFVAFTDAGHTTEALRFSRDQDSYTVFANVWSTDIDSLFDGVTDRDLAGGALKWNRILSTNRQEVAFAPDRINVYDDAGTVVISFAPLADGIGGVLTILSGAPARRSSGFS